MNIFTVTGNLGKTAELRRTQNNKAVLNFTLANTTGFGEHENTNWVRCAMFGDRAEKIAEYFVKGTKLIVTGEFSCRKWTDKEGKQRDSWELFVKDFNFAGGKKEQSSATPANPNDGFDDQNGLGDEIPFS